MNEKSLMTLSDEVTSDLAAAMKFSELMAKTQFIPKQFIGKPADVLACVMFGQEVGLGPMAALQNIAVINGTPSIYGDGMLAIIKNHPDFEDILESYDEATEKYTCIVKRKGQTETTQTFSKKDAQTAKLWGKDGPWSTYPKRMLMFRARSWALRDAFPDVLKGLIQAEEARDIPEEERNVTPEEDKTEKTKPVTDSIKDKVKKKTEKKVDKPGKEDPVKEEPIEIEVVDQEEEVIIQPNKEEIVRKIKALTYHAHISVAEAKTIEAITAADPIDKLNAFYKNLEPALFKRAQAAAAVKTKLSSPDDEEAELFETTGGNGPDAPELPIYE